jgi:hypothetical protein
VVSSGNSGTSICKSANAQLEALITCPVLDATPRFPLISAPQLVKINVMTEEFLLILVATATTYLDILQVEA